MTYLGRLSLRMRITLLAGTTLILCAAILTIAASYNARVQFLDLPSGEIAVLEEGRVVALDALPQVTTLSRATTAKKQFDMTGTVLLAVVSVLGAGAVYVLAGSSLRPIHDLSSTISAITEDNLRQRIPEEDRTDEVGALGHSFNIMLNRLEKSFLRQKRFSANVAHELKTPLATINAGLQVLNLEQYPSISDYVETFATTERNVRRLMAVVDDLLCLYGEQEDSVVVPIDLRELFGSIINELRPILDEKLIDFKLGFHLETVYGNPVLVYRAFFNLIENAAKYNKDGGMILVDTKAEGDEVRITVADTGRGVPSEEIERIFEPFYRVDQSRSRKEGGAGLGLSIVKAIVDKHGWTISAESELGCGSTFTILCRPLHVG